MAFIGVAVETDRSPPQHVHHDGPTGIDNNKPDVIVIGNNLVYILATATVNITMDAVIGDISGVAPSVVNTAIFDPCGQEDVINSEYYGSDPNISN